MWWKSPIRPKKPSLFRPHRIQRSRNGRKLVSGRAETIREDYTRAYLARREALSSSLRRLGWNFVFHRTDHLASEALVAVHMYLSGAPAQGGGRR